jgi:hypothetical protein
MEGAKEFRLDNDVRVVTLHVLKALVADYITEGPIPADEQLLTTVDTFMNKMPPMLRTGWQWMVRALEMSPLAMGYRRKFTNLSREEQVEVLLKYEDSQNYVQRGTVLGLKNLLVMIFFSIPEIEDIIGYDHKCLLDVKPAK